MKKIKLLWDKIKATPLDKKIGYILLTPALLSVLIFLLSMDIVKDHIWGKPSYNFHRSIGYTSSYPLYFGLMAIAGAYLIKDKK